MSSRKTSKGKESTVPKAVLKKLAHTREATLKRRLASIVRACLLNPATTKRLGHEIEVIDMVSQPLVTTIRIDEQYFSVRVQEHL